MGDDYTPKTIMEVARILAPFALIVFGGQRCKGGSDSPDAYPVAKSK